MGEIEELMRKENEKRNYERLLAIRALIKGRKPEDVAEEFGRCRATIYNWAKLWNENGWESLKYKAPDGRKPKLDADKLEEMKDILATKKPGDFDLQSIKAFGWVDMTGNFGALQAERCKREDFKKALLSFRKRYLEEVTILFNAKIHVGEEIKVFYEDNNILPVFFPKYSPDLNPEEQV